ncbi:MBL fold metallo-hydrolase [Fundicoccus culcitae]|uniref:MBL fold metallo-hydrolase n=2 Tax=Fundicoccus culcitae TaxID=2969821 RepID=A0ABY5P4D6_9LACT|nr:MBL fold metallo-hydrolase [Fundicoccus culcitae]UUX33350.1 MBL fold metallo-hydrolase [Fundicoccus culcitae]
MTYQYHFHDMTLTWLDGADTTTDAGTLFGPVPKVVWSRYYPSNEDNQLVEFTDPILIQYKDKNYLIDASLATDRMDAKQRRNNGVLNDNNVIQSLEELNLKPENIDVVMMTHMHNDHSGGLTTLDPETGEFSSTFPNAVIYMSAIEWDEVRHPNARTRGTYLKENWEAVQDQVVTFEDTLEVTPGITMYLTGGHSRGHSLIKLTQNDEVMLHMGDILLNHSQKNPLWVAAVDDYPMDSIAAKTKWLNEAFENGYKLFLYHDPHYAVIQYDEKGEKIIDYMERGKTSPIPWTEKQDRRVPFEKADK